MSETYKTNETRQTRPKTNRKRRGRGEGGICWREDRQCWEGSLSLGYSEGRRLRKRVFGKTKAAVLEEMARLRGKAAAPAEVARMTVAQLVARWLEDTKEGTSARTYEDRKAVCAAHVTPALGAHLAARLTGLQVQDYYARLRKAGVGPGSLRHAAKALRAALEYGVRQGVRTDNPSKAVRLPPEPSRDMVVLTGALAAHFLRRAARLPVYPLLALALGTGMRRGELLGLHWPDVDLGEAPAVTVRQSLTWTKAGGFALKAPKTNAARRTVGLPSFAAEALRVLRTDRLKAGLVRRPVFCTAKGGFPNFRNVAKAFDAAVEWANDPEKGKRQKDREGPRPPAVIPEGFRFHDMRHTHASVLLSGRESLKAVSARLGHANAALTLRIYAHVMPGDDARLARAMEAAVVV